MEKENNISKIYDITEIINNLSVYSDTSILHVTNPSLRKIKKIELIINPNNLNNILDNNTILFKTTLNDNSIIQFHCSLTSTTPQNNIRL